MRLLTFLSLLWAAAATHFAFGTIYWYRAVPDPAVNTRIITFEIAWRRNFPSWLSQLGGLKPVVGNVINVGSLGFTPRTGSAFSVGINYLVYSFVDVNNNDNGWIYGIFNSTQTLAASGDPWTIRFNGCCRLSTLLDGNRDNDWNVVSVVTSANRQRGPRSTGAARQYVQVSTPIIFYIPANLYTGAALTVSSFSRAGVRYTSSLRTDMPSFGAAGGMVLSSTVPGQLLWTPNTVGLYAMAFAIWDGVDWTPLDFIMEVLPTCNTQPFFSPLLAPTPQIFYKNIETVFRFSTSSATTSRTTFATWTVLPSTASIEQISRVGPTTTYQFKWTPSISDVSSTVCLQAVDSAGLFNCNSYCIELTIKNAAIIYASGIIRDFSKTPIGSPAALRNTDFARALTPNDYPNTRFVSSTLASDSLPVYSATTTPQTTSARTFNQWYRTISGINIPLVYSRTLSDIVGNGVYTWRDTQWWPIDSQGFGNEGDAHNYYFTWEVHTYITYNSSHKYTFMSSDDLWVYFNGQLPAGWNLQGLHNPIANFTVDMSAAQWKNSLVEGNIYPADIFYAHRSTGSTPGLQLQLPKADLCNALSVGELQLNYQFSNTAQYNSIFMTLINSYSNFVPGTFSLMANVVPGSSVAAYAGIQGAVGSVLVKVLQGFETYFTFKVDDTAAGSFGKGSEGFAFLMQKQFWNSVGFPASSLGYGGLPNSVAVEFDMNPNPANGDPAYQHLALHTRYNDTNCADSSCMIANSNNDPVLTMTNNTWHTVRMQYIPAQQGTTGIKQGWVYIWMNQVLAPILSVPLLSNRLFDAFLGAAYVGFSAGSSSSFGGNIQIQQWNITIVTISAAQTYIMGPTTVVAGSIGTLTIQSRDACGNNLLVGEEQGRFNVTIVKRFVNGYGLVVALPISVPVFTNRDGTYSVPINVTTARPISVQITLDGIPLQNSPYNMDIVPGPTSRLTTTFYTSDPLLPVRWDNAPDLDGIYAAQINPTTGNVISTMQCDLGVGSVASSWTNCATYLSAGSSVVVAAVAVGTIDTSNGAYTSLSNTIRSLGAQFSYTRDFSWAFLSRGVATAAANRAAECVSLSEYCSISASYGTDLTTGGSLFYVNATSGGTNTGAKRAAIWASKTNPQFTVGTNYSAVFVVIARDAFGNLNTAGGDGITYDLSPDIVSSRTGMISAPVNYPGTFIPSFDAAFYVAAWSTTKAGPYQLYISIFTSGGVLQSIAQTPAGVVVIAGPPSPYTSSVVGDGRSRATAGALANFNIQLADQYNNRLIYPPAAGVVSVQITLPGSVSYNPANTFPFVWTSSATGPNVYWFYQVTYNITTTGNMPLGVFIDGVLITEVAGQQITVVPGALSPSVSQIALDSSFTINPTQNFQAVSGMQLNFYVQAKDAFGNIRPFANAAGEEFTLLWNGGVSPLGGSYSSAYLGSGVYQLSWTPVTVGSLTLRVVSNANTVYTVAGASGQPLNGYSVSVVPGPAAFNSFLTVPATSNAPTSTSTYYTSVSSPQFYAVAGSVGTARVFSIDVNQNLRNCATCDDTSNAAFLISVRASSAVRAAVSALQRVGTTNEYIIPFNATIAYSWYDLQVSTSFDGRQLYTSLGAVPKVFVLPALTNPYRCTVGGPGASGALAGSAAILSIQARDSFDNFQAHWSDVFTVTVVDNFGNVRPVTVVPVIPSPLPSPVVGGLFSANFTIATGSTSYNVSVATQGIVFWRATLLPVFTSRPFLYFQSVSTPTSTVLPPGNANGNTKPYGAWIRQVNSVGQTPITTTVFASAQLSDAFDQVVSGVSVTVQSWSSVAPALQINDAVTASLYYVSFGAQQIGMFKLTILANGFGAQVALPSAGLPNVIDFFNVSIAPGDLSPPNCQVSGLVPTVQVVAGQVGTFSVVLKDSFLNIITLPSYVITASSPTTNSFTLSQVTTGVVGNVFTWTGQFTATVAGVQEIQVAANGSALGQPPYSVTIIPAGVDGPRSTVTLGSSLVAGSQATVFISLFDQYGNAVDLSTATFTITALNLNTADFTLSYQGSGIYKATFTPTTAGTYPLTAVYGLAPIGTPLSLTVLPGPWATVTPLSNPSVVAGNPLTTSFSIKDAYNNSWGGDAARLRVTATIGTSTYAATVTGTTVFVATIPGVNTRKAGSYAWDLKIDNVPSSTSFPLSAVVPGPIDATQTGLPVGTLPVLNAGKWREFTLVLRDTYGNDILGGFDGAQAQILFLNGSAQCKSDAEAANDTIITTFVADPAYGGAFFKYTSGSSLSVKYTTTIPGLYTVVFIYNGVSIPCTRFDRLYQRVLPGDPNPQRSTFTPISPSTITAGEYFSISVQIRDAYGNPTQLATFSDLALVAGGLPSTRFGFSVGQTQTANVGEYVMAAVIYSAGSRLVTLSLPTGNLDQNQTLVIVPATIQRWTFSSTQARAGVPFSFAVSGTDAFDNPVDISLYSFTVQLQIQTKDLFGGTYADQALTAAQIQAASDSKTKTNIEQCSLIQSCATVYTVDNTAVTYDAASNTYVGTALSSWYGKFLVTVSLSTASGVFPQVQYIYIPQATCAFETPSTPFRCVSGACVSAYSSCNSVCQDNQVFCGNQCAALASNCACPPTAPTACPGGYCSDACPSTSTIVCPSWASINCQTPGTASWSGQCRQSAADCPTSPVCAPGYVLCSDSQVCVSSVDKCPNFVSVSTNCTGVKCADGRCVAYLSDCPTPVTCKTGVLCGDGSCQASAAQCPAPSGCYPPTPWKCVDGSCRANLGDCPSGIVCPVGWVLCESRQCSQSLSACPNVTKCSASEVRCPDGSCRSSFLLCPSQVTCPPTTPVLCPDRSCVQYAFSCPASSICPLTSQVCPDGSCVQWNSDVGAWPACPTTTTCSVSTPVLCQDGSCQVSATKCPTDIPSCPLSVPVRCPDGSCKGNLLDCPSVSVCPKTLPVRCVDGRCVGSADSCPTVALSCPLGQIRCPGGECAAALALCPTHVTCPAGFERCSDGTCRQPGQCAAVAPSNCTIGTVACPQAVLGYTCATSLADCPQAPVCPLNQPVRCIDLSCRDTVSRCPLPPTTYKVGSVACPDGSFSASYQTCPTPVTCPPETPYKCFDQSCRISPTDCPTPRSCPSGSVYLCPNGQCTDRLDNCQSSSTRCDGTSIKCPDGSCAPTASVCPPIISNPNPSGTGCPDGSSYRCRDGSCAATCPSISCPLTVPYLCTDGMCALNSSYCNSAAGCPWHSPIRCYNGQCVASLASCPNTPNCPQGFDRCPNGLCVASALSVTQCPEPSGCLAGQLRCFDGTCVTLTQTTVGTINPCISGAAPGYTTLPNSCPFTHPYRCDSGYCALSSSSCPAINGYYCTNASFPIPCADGSCVQTSTQCPLVKPCGSNQVRCPGNGQCINGNDTSICPPYNMCAPGSRCANGLCSLDPSTCPLDSTGCPLGYLKCPNGQCASPNATCNPLASNGCSNPSDVKCSNGECVANAINCPYPNGCPFGSPYKCPGTGACVTATSLCASTSCANKPVRCGDGTCVATTSQCTAANGCPANKPYRCANGACQSYPATDAKAPKSSKCLVTVSCTSGKVLCANGQCADANKFCPPVMPCPSPKVQCADGSCKTNSSQCSQYCPPTSPITCTSGLCTRTTADCGVRSNSFQCADGKSVTSLKDCITWGNQLRDGTLTSSNAAVEGFSNCPSGYVACWDGSCGSSELNCPIIPACPLLQYRHWNGSCASAAPQDLGPKCPSPLVRNEDGFCRLSRLPFDGCALYKYYCPNRECVDTPSQCNAALIPNGRRALQQNGPTVCNTTDCNAVVKAVPLDYTVSISQASEVVIAINSQNVAVGRLSIPDGAIGTPGQSSVVLHIRPVAESEMRTAQNSLPPSRRAEFGNKDFTFAQTVLSTTFRCYVDSTVTQPFPVPVTYYATIDYQAKPDATDVCLAYLFVIGGTINYRRWQCLMSTKQRRVSFVRDLNAANPDLVRDSFSDCQTLYGADEGKIYSFIHAPLSKVVTIPPQLPGWWQRNALWITLVFLALGILVLVILYTAKRLYRYRKKYKEEQARVNQKREEVEEMEQFGGGAGVKDDEVAMTANPLTLQLKDMQKALEEKESERNKELERQKKEQNEARKDHIDALTADRDHLMAELEKLKTELENQQKAQALAAKPRTVDEEPTNTSGPTGAAAISTGGTAAPIKTNFQAAKPKRKDL